MIIIICELRQDFVSDYRVDIVDCREEERAAGRDHLWKNGRELVVGENYG